MEAWLYIFSTYLEGIITSWNSYQLFFSNARGILSVRCGDAGFSKLGHTTDDALIMLAV